ncbi:glycoside hydrolase family 140 protein [Paenibacillus sp. F411]|uniref:glycoside hydrolase family 140 protein n=1 Tax=Paenibacillus sp. F411 TaxID=2820239 RepID=UPI001AAF4434|nr:glycoside hydrolase family 140 protein [Paenibacillus sp. F411]MBO2942408.1 glycoside hydrolase family 140 protein [Paenibacillus sp. F411]
MQKLSISSHQRGFIKEDGTPFFWLGDTAWELFHKLTMEEAEHYLRTRATQGFTVVQVAALAELDGIKEPNAYGKIPLERTDAGVYDPAQPLTEEGSYDYWKHVDAIIQYAAVCGIYMALLPTWGDKYNLLWGKGPVIFNEENARAYGEWLGRRYGSYTNIVWVLGGDRPLTEYAHFAVNRSLSSGLRRGGAEQLMTFHPMGGQSSSLHVHHEAWLDFNMIQSGHSDSTQRNYEKVAADYARTPIKPVLDAEPCYEDHPIGFKPENGYFDQADMRKAAYYSLLSGACGHTYGHHSVWCMSRGAFASLECKEPGGYLLSSWQEALHRPGAAQMQYVRALFEPVSAEGLIPDASLLAANYEGANYIAAARNKRSAYYYTPNGLPLHVNPGALPGDVMTASWYNPRSGVWLKAIERLTGEPQWFTPPSSGRGEDWVLLVDTEQPVLNP